MDFYGTEWDVVSILLGDFMHHGMCGKWFWCPAGIEHLLNPMLFRNN